MRITPKDVETLIARYNAQNGLVNLMEGSLYSGYESGSYHVWEASKIGETESGHRFVSGRSNVISGTARECWLFVQGALFGRVGK